MLTLSARARVERRKHPLEGDQSIAAVDEPLDQTPAQTAVGTQAHPLTATVRSREEFLPAKQQVDVGWIQPKGNRRTAANPFVRRKYFLPGDVSGNERQISRRRVSTPFVASPVTRALRMPILSILTDL